MSECDMWRFSVKIFIVLCKQQDIGDENSQVCMQWASLWRKPHQWAAPKWRKPGENGRFDAVRTFPLHRSGLNFIITDSTNVLFWAQLSRLVKSLWSLQPSLQYLQSKRPFYLSFEDTRLWQLENVILKARTFHRKRSPCLWRSSQCKYPWPENLEHDVLRTLARLHGVLFNCISFLPTSTKLN